MIRNERKRLVMFSAVDNKGFELTFTNGWTVSVQWGPGNYCEHRSVSDFEAPSLVSTWESTTAEVAAWDKDEVWHNFGDDEVKGWMTSNEVLEFINMIASKKKC
jgi:hypothetical protein